MFFMFLDLQYGVYQVYNIKFPTKTFLSLSKSKKARVIKMYDPFQSIKKWADSKNLYNLLPER